MLTMLSPTLIALVLAAPAAQAPTPAAPAAPAAASPAAPVPVVTVDRDDVVVRESCRLVFAKTHIPDTNGNGVVRIEGAGITVDLGGDVLNGADPKAPADTFTGIGIVVAAPGVTLTNGGVRGFRCGVQATGADGATFQKLNLSGNYATRLLSSSVAEDSADWLWPHDNDNREWVTRYGASLLVERSKGVTIRDVTVRGSQNGIMLDRVEDSRIYDNDCSFLSGWGLAMWRSSNNIVCRNAFDFCIRGYSHGVYNRGQDSAGILLFEQCSKNTIALNSVTHGGDGLFGFAGKEALGERLPAGADATFTKGRGCNENVIVGNDFSFAAAHGLEMTFSFGNVIAHNTFESNAICGIWGGYSQGTLITENRFLTNGGGTSPGEGGGIDIEHGRANRIEANTFRGEGVAIEFWWDDDAKLLAGPWATQNGGGVSDGNMVLRNAFDGCGTALALRQTTHTLFVDNTAPSGEAKVVHDDASEVLPSDEAANAKPTTAVPTPSELAAKLPGLNNPIGKHRALGGREAIRMTSWGPWDGASPLLVLDSSTPTEAVWRLLGAKEIKGGEVAGGGSLRLDTNLSRMTYRINLEMPGQVAPYLLRARFDGQVLFAEGCLYSADWSVAFFPSVVDPRSNLEVWREGASSADSLTIQTFGLDFPFGHGGPRDLPTILQGSSNLDAVARETLASARDSKIGTDHFGMIAKGTLRFPPGTFTIRTVSDDGVRVIVDGATVIEDWTWHAPRESTGTVTFQEAKDVEVIVEHFELDGFSTLRLFIEGQLEPRRKAIFGR